MTQSAVQSVDRRVDTIVAVSSPPGRAARGLVRIAGPDACAATAQVVASPAPSDWKPRQVTTVTLRDPAIPALLSFFPSPQSYTGDDLVELQIPGHPALLERLMEALLAQGRAVRLAEPGEFTFRSFLSGKIDLTKAEGIAATISATSDAQLAAAAMLRHGRLGQLATDLVQRLGTLLALAEAGIDFVDQEDVVPIASDALAGELESLQQEVAAILRSSRSWGALEALPRVVLVGPPSSGKSTLFNALLGHERAVVHAEAGTTRDVLAEPLTLRGPSGDAGEVMLVDVAGLDTPAAALDSQIQQAASDAIASADLLLAITDAAAPSEGLSPLPLPAGKPILRVLSKADCLPGDDRPAAAHDLAVSVHTGEGLGELRSRLAALLATRSVSIGGDQLALQPRHQAALRDAQEGLSAALGFLADQPEPGAIQEVELVAGAMRGSLDALACLGGELTPDDVIGLVFSHFCVGK